MKIHLAPLFAAFAIASSATAQITVVDPSYGISTYYTHTSSDSIVSFDYGANGALYYQTVTPAFSFGGLYQYAGGVASNVVPASSTLFSGASVVSIGQSIYFNNSDASNTYIYRYGPLNGVPAASQISTATNYGLYGNQGRLFITGAPGFGTNHIYYGGLEQGDPAVDLGEDSGGSGPLAFNAKGDLYYAPGYGDRSIYTWSKAEVDAAIADPAGHPLAAIHQFATYPSEYSGGTSMVFDPNGDLLLTLSNFNGPSVLDKFGVKADGTWTGAADTVLSDGGLFGELRLEGGTVLLSAGNQIFALVPEPSTVCWMAVGVVLVGVGLRRRVA